MERTFDKIFLYLCCTFLLFSQISAFAPVLIAILLYAGALSCFHYYFSNKYFLTASAVCTTLLCLICPNTVYFLPLLVFDCAYLYKKLPFLPIVYFVPTIFLFAVTDTISDFSCFILLLLTAFSCYLARKAFRLFAYETDIKRLRDDSRELKLLSEKRQRELMEQHESELHIATLTERNRIAREIHDNVGHMLSRSLLQVGAIKAINQDSTLAPHLDALKDTLDTAMNNIRESVHDLKDESLNLYEMISTVLNSYTDYTIHFDYDISDSIPRDLKYCFLSIIKEALSNTVKHSDATQIQLILREHPANFQLLIEDNGSGAGEVSFDGEGIGLTNMKERVAAYQGSINIKHANGFRIFISIPVQIRENPAKKQL